MRQIRWLMMFALMGAAQLSMAAGFEIKAHLLGDKYEGKMVHLYTGDDMMSYQRIDSAQIQNGTVVFKGKLKDYQLLTMRVYEDDDRNSYTPQGVNMRPVLPLLIGNEKVEVTANVEDLEKDFNLVGGNSAFDYSKVQIVGSKTAQQYADYQTGLKKWITAWYAAAEPYYEFLQRREQSPLKEGVEAVRAALQVEQSTTDYVVNYLKENITTPAGVYALYNNVEMLTLDQINAMETIIPAKLKKSQLGMKVINHVDSVKMSVPGAMFYDCELLSPEGNTIRISDYCGKGKYTLLEFWASWCGPCRADIPHLKEAFEAYHPQGFEILSISMDDNKVAWLAAVKREQMNWPQGSTLKAFEDNLSYVYNFRGIPFCILVGPDGKIVKRNWRGSVMDAGLIEIYGNYFGDRYTKANTSFQLNGFIQDKKTDDPGHNFFRDWDGKMIYLYYSNGDRMVNDSSVINEGQFKFRGDLGCKFQKVMIAAQKMEFLTPDAKILQFYAEPATMSLLIDPDDFGNPTVYGSDTQKEYADFQESQKEVYSQLKELDKKAYDAQGEEREKLRAQMEPLSRQYSNGMLEYLKSHPQSNIAPELLMNVANNEGLNLSYNDLKEIYNNLNDEAKKTQEAQFVKKDLDVQATLQPGEPAPLFAKPDVMTGKTIDLSKFRGKYVILDFWATWCAPCRAANPHMKDLYKKYHKKGVEFIYIADDDNNEAKLKAAIKKDGVQMMHHILRGAKFNRETMQNESKDDVSDKYGIHFLPTKYLIDPEGKIVGKMETEQLEKKLEELFQ